MKKCLTTVLGVKRKKKYGFAFVEGNKARLVSCFSAHQQLLSMLNREMWLGGVYFRALAPFQELMQQRSQRRLKIFFAKFGW